MEAVHVAAFVYVDNWAYHSDHTPPLANALDSTVMFAEAFSLTIDWNKSWCWGTTQRMKDFWISSETLQDHYAAEVPLVQYLLLQPCVNVYLKVSNEASGSGLLLTLFARKLPWSRGAFGPLLFIVQRPSMFRSAK